MHLIIKRFVFPKESTNIDKTKKQWFILCKYYDGGTGGRGMAAQEKRQKSEFFTKLKMFAPRPSPINTAGEMNLKKFILEHIQKGITSSPPPLPDF